MIILGIIPARGGSKSIPRKNITSLCGKPLLAYTAEAAQGSKRLTKTIVSTDDQEIAAVARKYNLEVPFLRPADLAQDDTGMLPVIAHAVSYLEETQKFRPDIIVLLQPTSPLRKASHIDAAVDLLIETKADSVVSVVELPHHFNPVSLMEQVGDTLKPYRADPPILRRQDKPRLFARNGPAVLAVFRKTILEKNSLYGEDTRGFLMNPEESLDIDTPFDLQLAQCILSSKMDS